MRQALYPAKRAHPVNIQRRMTKIFVQTVQKGSIQMDKQAKVCAHRVRRVKLVKNTVVGNMVNVKIVWVVSMSMYKGKLVTGKSAKVARQSA
jgi:hypothetical protein